MSIKFKVLLGDITKLELDAIVNSANSSLKMGSGLSGAIHRAAGPKLYEECIQYGTLNPGQAVITKGYNLLSKYVIHTVTTKWYLNDPLKEQYLKSCYKESIKLAEENNIREIAFPCIGMGIYKCPLEIGAKIAIDIVKDQLESLKVIKKIYFICGNKNKFEVYRSLIENY